jgi:hypothetical protein
MWPMNCEYQVMGSLMSNDHPLQKISFSLGLICSLTALLIIRRALSLKHLIDMMLLLSSGRIDDPDFSV